MPKRQFIVKCKNCHKFFSSEIIASDKGADLDKLLRNKETCPDCHKTATYSEADYTFV